MHKGEISRRTLQRRLSILVRNKRVAVEGGGRSTRYLPLNADGDKVEDDYVRVSPSGAELRELVRRPQTERAPASYNRLH